jgi:hypothetical protein
MTRAELLEKMRRAHDDFRRALDGIGDDTMVAQQVVESWTIKDLMGHIALWHRVAIRFIDEYLRCGAPQPLGIEDDAAIDAFNQRGAARVRDWSLAQVRAEFDAAYRELDAAVAGLSDAQLNAQLPTPWDRSPITLEKLIAINSYEHEPEHTEQIIKWRGM